MTRGQGVGADLRRASGVALVIVALFVFIILASALQGAPEVAPRPAPSEVVEVPFVPIPEPTPTPPPVAPPGHEAETDLTWLSTVFTLIGFLIVGAILFALRRWLADLFASMKEGLEERRNRRLQPTLKAPSAEVAATEAEKVVAAALTAREILDQTPRATDAIIAAWIAFEEAVARSGRVRGTAETPAEFVVTVVSQRADVNPYPDVLLRLYENVRFGGLQATEDDRRAAAGALDRIAEAWR